MTGEEIERAINFLLGSQAKHDAQIAELHDIIRMQSESQTQFNETITQAVTALIEAQRRSDARHDAAIAALIETQRGSDARHDATDARIDRLVTVVERLAEQRG